MTDEHAASTHEHEAQFPEKCPNCGHADFERGKIGGEIYFAPETDENASLNATRTWKKISAVRCRNCGRLEIYAMPKKKK